MTHEGFVELLLAGDRTRQEPGPHLTPEFLRVAIAFAGKYVQLEKMLFGSPRVAYSPTALGMNLSITGDVQTQGEDLATAERERFQLPAGPILDVDRLIEDQGVKVIPRVFPAKVRARAGFFFESDLGPCIFYDASTTPAQRDYALAHQYGHFLADYDPYVHTICGEPSPTSLDDPRELRAHQFALAFLMPQADMSLYRRALDEEPGMVPTREFVQQLQVYFGVDNTIVLWRLLSLGWIDPMGVQALLLAPEGLLPEIDLEQMAVDERLLLGRPIPERYIHLVASAFGKGHIELPEAADFLESDVEEARRVLLQFHYEKATAEEKPAPPRPSPN
jgi:Zn-dependent peptidase ImmA (M78 family)